jgi:hypothetical protein
MQWIHCLILPSNGRELVQWKETQKVIRGTIPKCSKEQLKSYMESVELLRPTRGVLQIMTPSTAGITLLNVWSSFIFINSCIVLVFCAFKIAWVCHIKHMLSLRFVRYGFHASV